ncbi:hypothetical protein K443DRAFT_117780, partial [Laccaria amethystina LaAM-08-1]
APCSAIAAKMAAQFANGELSAGLLPKDPHDAELTRNIDIDGVRNRHLLTRGPIQDQIHEESGALASTRGVLCLDRSKAAEKGPPLRVHMLVSMKEIWVR